jgi:hypothetical protein
MVVRAKTGFGVGVPVLGGKQLAVRMEPVDRDRRVLTNMEDHQLEDWRTLAHLQCPVHDGL